MAIIIDDDEETNIMDHLVASQTPARSTTDCVLSTPVQALANASTGVSGSKQSSLATFFVKSSEVSWLLEVFLDDHLYLLSSQPCFQCQYG